MRTKKTKKRLCRETGSDANKKEEERVPTPTFFREKNLPQKKKKKKIQNPFLIDE